MELSDTRYELRGKIIRILKEKGSRGERADKILDLLLPTGLKHGEPVYDQPKQEKKRIGELPIIKSFNDDGSYSLQLKLVMTINQLIQAHNKGVV